MSETRSALIVDDDHDIRELLVLTLGRFGLRPDTAPTMGAAREKLATVPYALCPPDLPPPARPRLQLHTHTTTLLPNPPAPMPRPDRPGLDLISDISTRFPNTPVAMITAVGNVDAAVEALKAGAFDFVAKPLDINVLRGLVRQALELNNRRQAQPDEASRLLGNSEPMVALRQTIAKVARSQAPGHISGQSGTGKELVARPRPEEPPSEPQSLMHTPYAV